MAHKKTSRSQLTTFTAWGLIVVAVGYTFAVTPTTVIWLYKARILTWLGLIALSAVLFLTD